MNRFIGLVVLISGPAWASAHDLRHVATTTATTSYSYDSATTFSPEYHPRAVQAWAPELGNRPSEPTLISARPDVVAAEAGRGTPRTNISQNKQFNDAIKDGERQLGRTLSKDERSAVHREISGQDYGYPDIVNEVLGMFGGGQ